MWSKNSPASAFARLTVGVMRWIQVLISRLGALSRSSAMGVLKSILSHASRESALAYRELWHVA